MCPLSNSPQTYIATVPHHGLQGLSSILQNKET